MSFFFSFHEAVEGAIDIEEVSSEKNKKKKIHSLTFPISSYNRKVFKCEQQLTLYLLFEVSCVATVPSQLAESNIGYHFNNGSSSVNFVPAATFPLDCDLAFNLIHFCLTLFLAIFFYSLLTLLWVIFIVTHSGSVFPSSFSVQSNS